MKYMVLAAMVCVGSLSSSAQDGEVDMGTDSTDTQYWLISGSVKMEGDYLFAWFRTDDSKNVTVQHRSSKFRMKFDCVNERLGQSSTVRYAPNGSVMSSNSYDYPQMKPAVPGTVGAYFLGYLCPRYGNNRNQYLRPSGNAHLPN